uniref:glycylpeptide N-tetradecanoyltransferase n=1 Tax=viral metagenome TaxID=1070528 RepID=A0A6C0HS68_9ZZZZ
MFAVIIIVILCFVCFYIYLKWKHPFWFIQPVYHRFNIFCWGGRQREIRKDLPEKNKYYNSEIQFSTSDKVSWEDITKFVCEHFLKNKSNTYSPSVNEIEPYFKSHNFPSFVSLYYDTVHTFNTTNKKIIGMLTSRPLYIKNPSKTVYYVDFLCIDKEERKKGLASQLIQTHDYHQSHNSKHQVSLFRREGTVPYIVPLVRFNCVVFSMKFWIEAHHPPKYKILKVTPLTIHILYDFIQKHTCEMFVHNDIANLQELVRTNNVIIYMCLENDNVVSCYFFRKSCTIFENKEILILYASLKGKDFVDLFKCSLSYLMKNENFAYLCVEELGDNIIISENLKIKSSPIETISCGYYFYNYIHKQVKPKNCFFLN